MSLQRYKIAPLGLLLVLLFLFSTNGTFFQSTTPVSYSRSAGEFLKAEGGKLFLNGSEYREIGFNLYPLLRWYLGMDWAQKEGDGREWAEKSLCELSEHGFKVIRIMGPFYPAEFDKVFFDDDPAERTRKQRVFFAAFDAMLGDCDKYGIKIVLSLMWNIENLGDLGHHPLRDGLIKPKTAGFQKFKEYTTAVVGRYKDSPIILMWEIGNEFDLAADLNPPRGFIEGDSTGDILHPGPVVRDKRNNFSSKDLAKFFHLASELIRAIDGNHLITSGDSEEGAWYVRGGEASWKNPYRYQKSIRSHKERIRRHHRDMDVISVHHYLNGSLPLGWYKSVADGMDKPLFIGEIGAHFERTEGKMNILSYSSKEGLADTKEKLDSIVANKIPLSLWWTYGMPIPEFQLQYGKTDEALKLIEQANRDLKKRHR